MHKHAASVALFLDGKILLIERAYEPMAGYWTLPGGRVEPDETYAECAIREIEEELGLRLTGVLPVTTQTSEHFSIHVFTSRMPAQTPHPSDEITNWNWISLNDLGALKTTPGLTQIIKKAQSILTSK